MSGERSGTVTDPGLVKNKMVSEFETMIPATGQERAEAREFRSPKQYNVQRLVAGIAGRVPARGNA